MLSSRGFVQVPHTKTHLIRAESRKAFGPVWPRTHREQITVCSLGTVSLTSTTDKEKEFRINQV